MKRIYKVAILILGLLPFVACNDKLDLAPISEIGDNGFYQNEEQMETAVFAIYDGMQAAYQREFAVTEMRSDNTGTKNHEGEWAQFETMNVLSTNGVLAGYWAGMYNVAFRANKVLQNLDVVATESSKKQFEGEAKFARALAHFNLVRAFGDIPYIDEIVLPGDAKGETRVASATVLTSIAQDLTEAIELLPSRGETQEGRATSGAAKTLLAKVKLTQYDYSGAKTLLDELLADADYALVDDYRDVFYSEQNDEIIFAVQYINDNSGESQDFSYEFTNLGRSAGLNYITDNFDAFVGESETERATALYNPENDREVGKFVTSSNDNKLCGNDWIVLRMADVYLMHVEAIMAGADFTTNANAIESYNMIRERAGVATIATDGSVQLTKQMLLDERRIELAFENHRLYDLIRLGEADNAMSTIADELGFVYDSKKLILPIPQREINISAGNSGLLTQNPGY